MATPAPFTIAPARRTGDLIAIRILFEDYAASLGVDLEYQGFAAELRSLPGNYAPPHGELLLARNPAGRAIGCVALRPLDYPGSCEMKRLYVAPEGRGTGAGKALMDAIIAAARRIGYREMRLDTLADMTKALAMYRAAGFEETEPYYQGAPAGTVFMRLTL